MNWIIRNPEKKASKKVNEGGATFDSVMEPGPRGNRIKLLPWLTGAILIFSLLYGSSYAALLWLPPYAGMDMKSQLVADYSSWTFLVFQPVDPAVIEEIQQERGLPEKMLIDGGSRSTPTNIFTATPKASQTANSTPQTTVSSIPSSPSPIPPTYSSTTIPTSVITTPQPTVNSHPPATRKPHKTRDPKPKKTPKPK